jgi:hypothetical protein
VRRAGVFEEDLYRDCRTASAATGEPFGAHCRESDDALSRSAGSPG